MFQAGEEESVIDKDLIAITPFCFVVSFEVISYRGFRTYAGRKGLNILYVVINHLWCQGVRCLVTKADPGTGSPTIIEAMEQGQSWQEKITIGKMIVVAQ